MLHTRVGRWYNRLARSHLIQPNQSKTLIPKLYTPYPDPKPQRPSRTLLSNRINPEKQRMLAGIRGRVVVAGHLHAPPRRPRLPRGLQVLGARPPARPPARTHLPTHSFTRSPSFSLSLPPLSPCYLLFGSSLCHARLCLPFRVRPSVHIGVFMSFDV